MNSHCEHWIDGDDENFLLDDENISVKKCSNCIIKSNDRWDINHGRDNTNEAFNGAVLSISGLRTNMDDTLEDSPLLINDCYTQDTDFHCHSILTHSEDKRAWKKLLIASILCFIFMLTEIVGGYLADSLAVMTDAAHLFSDFIGFLISLLSIWVARKPPTKHMTFGYHRAEVLGAFLSVITVWLLALIFAVLAISRIYKKEYEIAADTMIIVASLGLAVNLVMGGVLCGFCHNHSHGLNAQHSHQDYNINVRAAAAHVLGDLLQSLGVLVAAIIIKIFPNAKIADPICTLIFSVFVICTTANVAKDSIWLILEGSPKNTSELNFELKNLPGVRHVHNLHIWSLSPGKDVVSVHLCVDKYCDRDVILKKATFLIKSKLSVVACTVQVEMFSEDLISSCNHCQFPQC